ncbi:hypothetical protein LRS10_21065 [Phenylobacterium sp. J426]|uniref:hypothetical protein n=1 Tax=Phenylobacterium sp. J426 TaxID=2898439 RepID=UPI002151CC86|nr:hypothetical protein [Phenylobacterium sp. J426]MCR5876414.1 hypothetical protein [Phenylobacterium sp. J426]
MKRAASLFASVLLAAFAPAPAPPHGEPEVWTPAELSAAAYESTPTLSPDGRELIYLSADPTFRNWRLLMSRCEAGRWTTPGAAALRCARPGDRS